MSRQGHAQSAMNPVIRHLVGALDGLGPSMRALDQDDRASDVTSPEPTEDAAGIRRRLGLELAWAREVLQAGSTAARGKDPVVAIVRRFALALGSVLDALGPDDQVRDPDAFRAAVKALSEVEGEVRARDGSG